MKKIIKSLILLFIILFSIFIYSYTKFEQQKFLNEDTEIVIKKSETFRSLSSKINWINDLYLRIYLKKNPPLFNLQAWKYKLSKNSSIIDIIKSLRTPINETDIQITFLEWWNIYDIDDYLAKKWLIKEWEFIKSAENYDMNLAAAFPFLDYAKTFEWFLYPDTYNINPNNFSVSWLINRMLNNFNIKVYDKLLSKYSAKEILDIITLASIVEKEEKNPLNKPVVAWILKKRLKEWWMIWADITVCYPHKLTSEECKMVVSKYINEKSSYNTRTMVWLPETPIWNPSFSTINSTINSEETPYYFYLHSKDGNIYYSKDNEWHEINKQKYLK